MLLIWLMQHSGDGQVGQAFDDAGLQLRLELVPQRGNNVISMIRCRHGAGLSQRLPRTPTGHQSSTITRSFHKTGAAIKSGGVQGEGGILAEGAVLRLADGVEVNGHGRDLRDCDGTKVDGETYTTPDTDNGKEGRNLRGSHITPRQAAKPTERCSKTGVGLEYAWAESSGCFS